MSIILTIIGIVLFFGGIIAGCSLKQYEIEEKGNEKAKFPKGFVVVVLVGLIVFGVGNSLVIIPTGYTGVKSTFGQIDETTIQNGANWKIPFIQKIEKVNNKQQDIVFD